MDIKEKIKNIGGYLFYIILGIFVALILREIIPRSTYKVSGMSMFPTYQDGEKIKTSPYKRGDSIDRYSVVVVNYKFPYAKIIKRIVALPGETVFIDEYGNLFVDGEQMDEELIYTNGSIASPGIANQEIQLADDEYFLIGDNTQVSLDSRTFGPIKKKQIVAIVNN